MVKQHIKRVVVCGMLGAILGAGIYLMSPKIYQSSGQILIATTASGGAGSEVASLLSTSAVDSVGTEISILRSRGMFHMALEATSEERGRPDLMNRETEDQLYKMYDVEGMRDSRAADLVVKAYNPQLAADIAANIPIAYNKMRSGSYKSSVADATEKMEEQLKTARRELGKAEAKLRDFKLNAKIVDLGSKASQLVNYQSTLIQQIDTTSADLKVVEASIGAMRRQMGNLPDLETTGHTDTLSPVVAKFNDELANYEAQRTALLRSYTEESVRVREVDELIKRTKEKIVAAEKDRWMQTNRTWQKDAVKKQFKDSLVTSQVSQATLRRRLSSLDAALSTVNKQISEMPQNETELAQLTRDRDILESKYKSIRANLEDLVYKGDAGMGQARVLFEPVAQSKPVAPDLTRLLVVCIVGGLIVGFLYSIARESLRATAQTSVELSHLLGLPVAATMPQLPPKYGKAIFRSLPSPEFKPLESFKFMAFSMLYSQDNPPKRVLFTSIGGSVGCSTSATQFAIAASKTGKPTVLLDGDLRHMTVSKIFQLENKTGVREVINKMILPSEDSKINYATNHDNLTVVPSGSQGGEGITDVPVGSISAFLDTLQEHADAIVIDSPPCDVVSDALRFAPYVDSVCLVASARTSKYPNIALAIDLLKRAGAKDVRLVMTHASPEEEAFSRKSLYLVK